jgi:hypothetical protein
MEIKADVTLPYARELVFVTYRDRIDELTEYLPNIRSIRVIDRKEQPDGVVELVNEWLAGGDIPAVARSFVNESMLKWTDYATWRPSSFAVEWRTDVHAFPGAIKSQGMNRYVLAPEGMKLEIRGQLVCDPGKIPGLPRLLHGTVAPTVERILVGAVQTNLVAIGKGVGKLLAKS